MKLNNAQFNKYLGKKIKKGRKKAGIKQEDLAKKLGFSRIAMSTYESGRSKFTVYQLMLTAEILGLPFEFFLPKSTRQVETKTEIPKIKIEEDTEFVLELAIRSYLLSRGVKKTNLQSLTNSFLKEIRELTKKP